MILEAALNGARSRAEHPALPISARELAQAVAEAVAAGADVVHFHVRAMDGRESLGAGDVARTLEAIREAAPATPLGISTGAWIVPEAPARLLAIGSWAVMPDFASVNFVEDRAIDVARLLLNRKVGVEAGVSDLRAAEVLGASGLASRCLRVLIEPQEKEVGNALRTAASIEAALDRAGIVLPRILHGVDRTAWRLFDEAVARGYDARIGLEDTLILPEGGLAEGNAALVAAARDRIRRPASH